MNADQLNAATLKAGVRYLAGEDRIRDALRKKWMHQNASGHVVPLIIGKIT
jgi:hypothetical protein